MRVPAHPSDSGSRRGGTGLPGQMLAATALVALWAATLVPFLSVGADNARLVAAFHTDEAMLVNLLAHLHEQHSFRLVFGAYGHLYFNLTLSILGLLGPLSERAIVETARGLSLACATALLLFTFAWARRLYGSAAAWVALALVALNPTVYTWAVMVHPDMLQALLLMAALFYTVRCFDRPTTAHVVIASAFAGLAFAAKYSGVFVLPLIGIAAVGRVATGGERSADLRLMLSRTLLAVVAVALTVGGYAIDAAWIITHLTADGHIDVPLMVSLDTAVFAVRFCGLLLAVVVVLPWTWDLLRRYKAVATALCAFAVAAVTFLVAFAATSPYSFLKLAFLKGLYFEATETGAMMSVQWVEKWTNGIVSSVGWPLIVPLVCTAIWLLQRRHFHPLWSVEVVLLSWIGLYLTVLLAPFHELLFHYTLPLIAPAAILSARGIVAACETLAHHRVALPHGASARAIAVPITLLCLAPAVTTLLTTREISLRRTASANAAVGDWMTQRFPPSTSIAYDYLTYIPPRYTRVAATWGGSRPWLAKLNPDVVVVNRWIASAWRGDPGKEAYYHCLETGTCSYERIFALDAISVYQRRGADPASATNAFDDSTD